MNSRVRLCAGILAVVAIYAGCRRAAPAPLHSPAPPSALVHPRLVVPERGVYTGAYMDWGEREDAVTVEGIETFERLVGKHQAIVASSSYWGEGTFPLENVQIISEHGAVPLIFWSPWDKPYVEGRGPDKFSLTSIIAGEHDAYIDAWAIQARAWDRPLIVSFANEMNGEWFPWSGVLYGGAAVVPGSNPPRYQGPETFKQAYRHVVDRVRAQRANNIQWVLHLMNYSMPQDKWNLAVNYYPGPEYCDWLGISLYGSQFPGDAEWAPFYPLFDWPYTELTQLDPVKPIMLCEWGAAELPHLGSKGEWIQDAFRWMKDPRFGRLKACVFWHERWENSEGENKGTFSNLRVNSSPEALESYRQGVADPFYLSFPILREARPDGR